MLPGADSVAIWEAEEAMEVLASAGGMVAIVDMGSHEILKKKI